MFTDKLNPAGAMEPNPPLCPAEAGAEPKDGMDKVGAAGAAAAGAPNAGAGFDGAAADPNEKPVDPSAGAVVAGLLPKPNPDEAGAAPNEEENICRVKESEKPRR